MAIVIAQPFNPFIQGLMAYTGSMGVQQDQYDIQEDQWKMERNQQLADSIGDSLTNIGGMVFRKGMLDLAHKQELARRDHDFARDMDFEDFKSFGMTRPELEAGAQGSGVSVPEYRAQLLEQQAAAAQERKLAEDQAIFEQRENQKRQQEESALLAPRYTDEDRKKLSEIAQAESWLRQQTWYPDDLKAQGLADLEAQRQAIQPVPMPKNPDPPKYEDWKAKGMAGFDDEIGMNYSYDPKTGAYKYTKPPEQAKQSSMAVPAGQEFGQLYDGPPDPDGTIPVYTRNKDGQPVKVREKKPVKPGVDPVKLEQQQKKERITRIREARRELVAERAERLKNTEEDVPPISQQAIMQRVAEMEATEKAVEESAAMQETNAQIMRDGEAVLKDLMRGEPAQAEAKALLDQIMSDYPDKAKAPPEIQRLVADLLANVQ